MSASDLPPPSERGELEPCPFCGCTRIYDRGFRRFECPDCRAEGPPSATRAEAVAAWNIRALSAEAQITALKAERDALMRAAGFKPGSPCEIVLKDISGMRPAMVEARRSQRAVESDATLWQCLMFDEPCRWGGQGLLATVWNQRREAERRAEAAEAQITQLEVERDEARADRDALVSVGARWTGRAYDAEAKTARLSALLDQAREVVEGLVEEKADYMRLNHLGDPERQHTVKVARAFLTRLSKTGGEG